MRKTIENWVKIGFREFPEKGQLVAFNEVGGNIQLFTVTETEVISEYHCSQSDNYVKIVTPKNQTKLAPWQVVIGEL